MDTHKTVKNLIESGFTEKQAEAIILVTTESLEARLKPSLASAICIGVAFVIAVCLFLKTMWQLIRR